MYGTSFIVFITTNEFTINPYPANVEDMVGS